MKIIDSFAGGGGASQGIFQALGRHPDIAINHDSEAIAMHEANHPSTKHYCKSVYDISPEELAEPGEVGLMWASPDCTHFSKAKGGKPRKKEIRDLAHVVVDYARVLRPKVIILENVEEFKTWGPLDSEGQPIKSRAGETFHSWLADLRALGYEIEWRELRACDYGAPTIRKRLFVIARCDGKPIVWPKPTHGQGRKPYRPASEIIDWSIPCPSIFDRKKPLADATLRRIARGIVRYVLDTKEPFIVKVNHGYNQFRGQSIHDPLQTNTSKNGFGLVMPTLIQTGYGERPGQQPRIPGLEKPIGTIVSSGKHALVSAFLAKHYGGPNGAQNNGVSLNDPTGTVTSQDHHALIAAHLTHFYGSGSGQGDPRNPMKTVSAGGLHAGLVAALLEKFIGYPKQDSVTVTIDGESFFIADIGMRMLSPRELFLAQGFPASYIIDPIVNGKPLTKTAQTRCCGNSVCPDLAEALVRENLYEEIREEKAS